MFSSFLALNWYKSLSLPSSAVGVANCHQKLSALVDCQEFFYLAHDIFMHGCLLCSNSFATFQSPGDLVEVHEATNS